MDFITGLPRVKCADTMLVVIDRLTKYEHFIAIRHPYTAKDIVEIFIKDVVRLHGFLRSIVTNCDYVFISNFLLELFKAMGTSLKVSSTYHP